jgi:hypothetical protein
VLDTGAFEDSVSKTRHFVPQASIVGTLLFSNVKPVIIASTANQIRQHDPFTWEIKGTNFVTAKEFSSEAVMFDKTLKKWLLSRNETETKEFVTSLFNMITSSGSTTVTELFAEMKENPGKFLLYIAKLDSKIKKPIQQAIWDLFKTAGKIVPKEISGLLNIKENEV